LGWKYLFFAILCSVFITLLFF